MPTPIRWQVPIALSPEEARVAAVLHRTGKFYVFLRQVRAELFDDAFQAELAAVYRPREHVAAVEHVTRELLLAGTERCVSEVPPQRLDDIDHA